jgi:N utilization substance protein B
VSARSKARKRALDILFAADVRQIPVADVLGDEAQRAASEPDRESSWLYAREIVDGYIDHSVEVDEAIQTYARGWTLERMPSVDRAILRVSVWELLYNRNVPAAAVISEAVELATDLGSDDSPRFVNGLLAAVAATIS